MQAGKCRGPLRRPPGLFVLFVAAFTSAIAGEPPGWTEAFSQGRLDPARWEITADGDFRDRAVDVVDVNKRGPGDFRLQLRADTRGTRDDTVKFLGVRSVRKIPLGEDTRISAELDWNDQTNGSYLSAGLILSPLATSGSPLSGPDWLRVEYIGVPPGQNARMVISIKANGRERTLYTEGWPDTNRAGRKVGLQQLTIITRGRAFQVWENGQLMYDAKTQLLSFEVAYVYLQLSSHSNYPAREIYFDNVQVVGAE